MSQLPFPESVDQVDQVIVPFGLFDERMPEQLLCGGALKKDRKKCFRKNRKTFAKTEICHKRTFIRS